MEFNMLYIEKMNNIQTPNYPFNEFPEKLRDVIKEQFDNNEAGLPTIGCCLIGALSAAIQDKVDVEVRPGTVVPSTVFTLVVAGSGARKTTVDTKMTKVASNFDKTASEAMKPQHARQKAKYQVWKLNLLRLEKQIQKGSGDEDELNQIQNELEKLYLDEPKQIPVPRMLYRDATPEAITKGLHSWRSGWLTTSEAASMFGGRTMSNLGLFNSLWDGSDLTVDRASSESYIVENPRLTISLMVQKKVFFEFLENKGSLARDNGFLARFLVCFPTPLEGSRFRLNATNSWDNHENFQARLMEILMSTLPIAGVYPNREVLTLSADARIAIKYFTDQVERAMAPGQALSDISDCASKVGENAVRLAGLFHYYEGIEGPITSNTIKQAIAICEWHMNEFIRLFCKAPELPPEVQDAMAVEKFLRDRVATFPRPNMVPKTYLFTHGPKTTRKKERLDLALHVLCMERKITLIREGKTFWVCLLSPYPPEVSLLNFQPNYAQILSIVPPTSLGLFTYTG